MTTPAALEAMAARRPNTRLAMLPGGRRVFTQVRRLSVCAASRRLAHRVVVQENKKVE